MTTDRRPTRSRGALTGPLFGLSTFFVSVTALSLGALAATPASAHAQSPRELAQARALFQSGLEAARDGRWEDARSAFERSLAIAERPNTVLNLAGAQAQTGQLVASAASYRRYLAIATGGREAAYRAQAEQALREVEPRIARLTIATAGLAPSDEVRLDGEPIARAALRAPVAVDPGRHVVTAIRDGEELARQVIALGEGEARTVAIEVRAPVEIATTGRDVPVPAIEGVAERDAGASGGDDTWVWVGVGIGAAVVVGVAVGVGVAVATSGTEPLYTGNLGDGMIRF